MRESETGWAGNEGSPSDVTTLRESLAVAERRAATLAELSALLSEGRNSLALAQRGVELTARATRADGAFVYLWDRDEERLVLRVATDGWQRGHLGRIKLRVGEGVTGWVALARQPVLLAKDPQKDPRFKPFPELRESSFRSMVAVPIVAPGEEVLGVFTLYALKRGAFSPSDVSLATEVGALLASGLVQAETLGQLKVQSAAAQFLRELPDTAWGSLEHCLQAMAEQCGADLDADVCVIEVTTDHSQPHKLTSATALSSAFREEHGDKVGGRKIDRSILATTVARLNLQRLRIPLGTSAPIGAVTCYRQRRFTSDDELLLEGIGTQVAAGALSLYGTERVRPVVDQLLMSAEVVATEQILKRNGWKTFPSWPLVVRIDPTTAGERAPEDDRLRVALEDALNGDLTDFVILGGGQRFVVLADATHAGRRIAILERLTELGRRPNTRVSGGAGPIAGSVQELHRSIKHAIHASHWAELVAPVEGTVLRYEDVAHLRLLPRTALAMSPDLKSLMGSLGAVVKYDLDNSTDLALTLDSFLTNSGTVAKSAEELFIHRNTLRQRIQRIEELIGTSPEHFEDWVTAGVAARLIKESEADLRKQPGQRTRCPNGVSIIGRSCCGLPNACPNMTKA